MNQSKILSVNSFQELKKIAWIAVVNKDLLSPQQWERKFITCYKKCSLDFIYKNIIDIYEAYRKGDCDKLVSIEKLKRAEQDFNRRYKTIFSIKSFFTAEQKAFEMSGQAFGKVSFICPLCKGNAKSVRISTPDNIAHSVTVRSYCSGCGFRSMN